MVARQGPIVSQTHKPCLVSGPSHCSLGYADDTTLMAESEEELKSLLMKVKEESDTTEQLN